VITGRDQYDYGVAVADMDVWLAAALCAAWSELSGVATEEFAVKARGSRLV
jgi:hypothetical protein